MHVVFGYTETPSRSAHLWALYRGEIGSKNNQVAAVVMMLNISCCFVNCRRFRTACCCCTRFIVAKEEERSEVKVQQGPEGFTFLKGDPYIFRYSFRAVEDMMVSNRFTHLGQLKGSAGGYMLNGDPIYSLTANNNGLMVRFSNKESIEDFYPGMEQHLDWEDATGEWVHVEIETVFGESMEVRNRRRTTSRHRCCPIAARVVHLHPKSLFYRR